MVGFKLVISGCNVVNCMPYKEMQEAVVDYEAAFTNNGCIPVSRKIVHETADEKLKTGKCMDDMIRMSHKIDLEQAVTCMLQWCRFI